jgi:hypothetical protein
LFLEFLIGQHRHYVREVAKWIGRFTEYVPHREREGEEGGLGGRSCFLISDLPAQKRSRIKA